MFPRLVCFHSRVFYFILFLVISSLTWDVNIIQPDQLCWKVQSCTSIMRRCDWWFFASLDNSVITIWYCVVICCLLFFLFQLIITFPKTITHDRHYMMSLNIALNSLLTSHSQVLCVEYFKFYFNYINSFLYYFIYISLGSTLYHSYIFIFEIQVFSWSHQKGVRSKRGWYQFSESERQC